MEISANKHFCGIADKCGREVVGVGGGVAGLAKNGSRGLKAPAPSSKDNSNGKGLAR